MAYDRYRQGQRDPRDYSTDSRDTYSSARDYQAAGQYDRDDRGGYGNDRYGGRSDYDQRPSGYYGANEGYGRRDYGRQDYGQRDYAQRGDSVPYRGSYGSDGHRFTDVENDARRDYGAANRGDRYGNTRGGYGRSQAGYDRDERGFFDRAGDEVRSWFGDREAEQRREQDARYDQQHGQDDDYHGWRSGQIAAFDRDYSEYRQENRAKFQNEFASWRTERQGQRDSLSNVTEHMEVVGSDGSHVGTVDKVRGDRIVLTKTDQDAGGKHHSIPSRWINTVDDKVTLRKTADEAQREWRDEERNQAFFNDDRNRDDDRNRGGLNRAFSGTY